MTDRHIHLEKGPFSSKWAGEFVKAAQNRGIDRIGLLEHCYLFPEFAPMYEGVRGYSDYFADWYRKRVGIKSLEEYLRLAETVRAEKLPVKVEFGLEVCYFEGREEFIRGLTRDLGLDFLVGSVHHVDDFPYDFSPSHWEGLDTDRVFRRYFEISVSLAKSGLFDGIAHPDCIKLYGKRPSFDLGPYYEKLACAAAEAGMYAEENSGAARRAGCEFGLAPGLMRAFVSHGVKFVCASDAHCPEDVGKGIAEAAAAVDTAGGKMLK